MTEQTLEAGSEQEAPTGKEFREKLETAVATNASLTTERDVLKRENAVLKAGLGDLKPKQLVALLAAHEGDDLTPAALKATAVDLGFAEADVVDEEQQAADAAAAGQQKVAAAQAGAGGSQQSGVLTPAEVGEWPQSKLMRLNAEHPDIFERLMRGETVTGFKFT